MAHFSVEIADEDVGRVLAAMAANYRRPDRVPNPDYVQDVSDPTDEFVDNPETLAQFANRMVRRFLSEHVVAHEMEVIRVEAEAAANTSITINDPQL
jgi:hypothetical protein